MCILPSSATCRRNVPRLASVVNGGDAPDVLPGSSFDDRAPYKIVDPALAVSNVGLCRRISDLSKPRSDTHHWARRFADDAIRIQAKPSRSCVSPATDDQQISLPIIGRLRYCAWDTT